MTTKSTLAMLATAAAIATQFGAGPLHGQAQLHAVGVPRDPKAVGYLNLHERAGSDGPAEFDSYEAGAGLFRLQETREFLESFKRLTQRVRDSLTQREAQDIGNMAEDTQDLAFHNIPLIVEGTILKQQYQLTQARYELATLRRARGQASAQDVDAALSAYENATTELQTFWDTKFFTD